MSINSNDTASIEGSQSFDQSLDLDLSAALFHPMADVRARKRAENRANAPFSKAQWNQLDAAVANPQPVGSNSNQSRDPTHALTAATLQQNQQLAQQLAELEADTTLQPDTWTEQTQDLLEEHDAQPNLLGRFLSDGYGRQTNLSRYVWTYDLVAADMGAEVSKNGRRTANQDRPVYGTAGIPLPIMHSDYELDSREYQNSQAHGDDLDDRTGSEASLAVRRKEDDVTLRGWGGQMRTNGQVFTLDGIAEDNGKTITGTAVGDFATESNIFDTLDDIVNRLMTQASGDHDIEAPDPVSQGMYLLVGTPQFAEINLGQYESSATDESVLDRMGRKYPYIDLVHSPRLDDGEVVGIVQNRRYFDIVVAQGMTNLNWQIEGGMALRNKVLSSRVPVVKEQPDNVYGMAYYTGA